MKRGGLVKGTPILSAITLISGICFGGMYEITKLSIQESEMKADLMTYQEVYPNTVDFKFDRALQDATRAAPKSFASVGLNIGSVEIPMALSAVGTSGNVVGHIFTGLFKDGYGGNTKVSVGTTNEGEITGIGFIETSEAPGLGMNVASPDFKSQFKDKTAEQLNLVKDGGVDDDGVDAMSSTTVTSTTVVNAINRVLYSAHNCIP